MNFYNPYFNTIPYTNNITNNAGLFSKLLGGRSLNISSILSGTGKVINFANQAIPLVKQVSPLIKNAKTMFKVMNEFKKFDEPKNITTEQELKNDNVDKINTKPNISNNGPTFFI